MFAEVIIDLDNNALDRVFDYGIENLDVCVGDRVLVPFGNKAAEGFVMRLKDESACEKEKIKNIIRKLDAFTAISQENIKLLAFMKDRYHLRSNSVLRLFIPSELRTGAVKEKKDSYITLNVDLDIEMYFNNLRKNAVKVKDLIFYLKANKEEKQSVLNSIFGSSALKKLKDDHIVMVHEKDVARTPFSAIVEDKNVTLTKMQQDVIKSVDGPKTYLLHGVTGSGKTEVYMNLISSALASGKTAIMLVPEISLTPQMLSTFKGRFKDDVAILHSGLSAGERFDEWRRLKMKKAKIALGARSAIFAPLENLGIIIIDEEHERSYISESNPRYDTREVAQFRANVNNCALVLGSATPSLQSYYLAEKNEYKLLELPTRVNGKTLPKIQIIDMTSEIRNGNTGIFSEQLLDDMFSCVQNKKQVMLFINRRGFSSFMMCRECGYVPKCEACDVSLVYHKAEDKLKCHYCAKQYRALTKCPKCGSASIKQGAIGTERVAEELKKLYPDVKVFRMDNDTTSKKNSHEKILSEFRDSLPAFLVGTQMIVKGHDFENVTLAGIIDADQSLYNSDYSSAERTFSLITQMSGRAGRSVFEGKVVLQTYAPKHYVYRFAANYDYKGFYKKEINLRETTLFPPFSKIIRVLFSSVSEDLVRNETRLCYNEIEKLKEDYKDSILYLGAMKSPLKKIQNKYRYQIIVRLKKGLEKKVEDLMFEITQKVNPKVSVFFEIDPTNLS